MYSFSLSSPATLISSRPTPRKLINHYFIDSRARSWIFPFPLFPKVIRQPSTLSTSYVNAAGLDTVGCRYFCRIVFFALFFPAPPCIFFLLSSVLFIIPLPFTPPPSPASGHSNHTHAVYTRLQVWIFSGVSLHFMCTPFTFHSCLPRSTIPMKNTDPSRMKPQYSSPRS